LKIVVTGFSTGVMLFLVPINSIKALKAKKQKSVAYNKSINA